VTAQGGPEDLQAPPARPEGLAKIEYGVRSDTGSVAVCASEDQAQGTAADTGGTVVARYVREADRYTLITAWQSELPAVMPGIHRS
jgi:hypothetical protein